MGRGLVTAINEQTKLILHRNYIQGWQVINIRTNVKKLTIKKEPHNTVIDGCYTQ